MVHTILSENVNIFIRRKRKIAKFMVSYEGHAYIEADSAEEAEELFHDGDSVYSEQQVTCIHEVDDFSVFI